MGQSFSTYTKKINSLTQNGLSLSEYFNKLDSYWKEFDGLVNLTDCTCTAAPTFQNHAKINEANAVFKWA